MENFRRYGSVYFGSNSYCRSQLRKILGLGKGNTSHAHHIIPLDFVNNPIIQKAAHSNSGFQINDLLNGIPLPSSSHLISHNAYNQKISQVLTTLNAGNPNLQQSFQKVNGFAVYLKNLIKNNPNLNLGEISNLIIYNP